MTPDPGGALPIEAVLEAFSTRVEAGEGGVRLVMPRNEITVGGVRNSINGGVIAALVELAGQLALRAVLAPGEAIAGTAEVGLSYLSSARGEETVAEARVLRKGGRLCVCHVEVRDGATGVLNAVGRVSCVLERGVPA